MRKIIFLALFVFLTPSLVLGGVNTFGIPNYGGPKEPDFKINLVKYDPYPAERGEYMTLWLEVHNIGTNTARNVIFELEPEYPFSLDSSENATREFYEIPGLYTLVLQYKIRVDKDAVEGWNEIKLKYKIGESNWVEDETEIYVSDSKKKAELKAFYVGSDPKPYPGGETKLSVDIANIASGTAYYTYVSAESKAAEIEVNKVFVGTMDPDDFDTIDFDFKIKNVTPGRYPVTINFYYKDDDDENYETNDTVYLKIYTKEEAMKEVEKETPWWQYIAYILVVLVIIKYFIVPATKKSVSFFKKKK